MCGNAMGSVSAARGSAVKHIGTSLENCTCHLVCLPDLSSKLLACTNPCTAGMACCRHLLVLVINRLLSHWMLNFLPTEMRHTPTNTTSWCYDAGARYMEGSACVEGISPQLSLQRCPGRHCQASLRCMHAAQTLLTLPCVLHQFIS